MNQLQVLLHTALIDSGHIEKCGLLIRDTSQIKTTSVGYKVCVLIFEEEKKNKANFCFIL